MKKENYVKFLKENYVKNAQGYYNDSTEYL